MKNKILCFLALILLLASCKTGKEINNFKDLSSYTRKKMKANGCAKPTKYILDVRNEISDKVNFINYKVDTIYILSYIEPQSSAIIESIWNVKGKIEYIYHSTKKLYTDVQPNFPKRYYNLIENWDLETIRKEEKDYSDLIPTKIVKGMKIILDDDKQYFDCVSFEYFFNPKVDAIIVEKEDD